MNYQLNGERIQNNLITTYNKISKKLSGTGNNDNDKSISLYYTGVNEGNTVFHCSLYKCATFIKTLVSLLPPPRLTKSKKSLTGDANKNSWMSRSVCLTCTYLAFVKSSENDTDQQIQLLLDSSYQSLLTW